MDRASSASITANAAVIALSIVVLAAVAQGQHPADEASAVMVPENQQECSQTYASYLNHLTPSEVKLVCYLMKHIQVTNNEQNGFGNHALDDAATAVGGVPQSNRRIPTEDELRALIHVDTNEDLRRQQEELKRVEQQETLLRQRIRDNTIVRNVLREIGSHLASAATNSASTSNSISTSNGGIYADADDLLYNAQH